MTEKNEIYPVYLFEDTEGEVSRKCNNCNTWSKVFLSYVKDEYETECPFCYKTIQVKLTEAEKEVRMS